MTSRRDRIEEKKAKLSPEQRELLERRLAGGAPKAAGASAGMVQVPGGELPLIAPDREGRHLPFPLNDIQQAYWLGRSGAFELGNVAEHIYIEIEGDLDLPRFSGAFGKLIERHDMLRAVVLPDGTQQILACVPAYAMKTLDLRDLDPAEASARLEAVKDEMSHQVLPTDRWPLFDLRSTLLGPARIRVHMSIDGLLGDAWSLRILFQELADLYRDPSRTLPALEVSFRDYMLAKERIRATELYARSRQHWMSRIAALPPAPQWPQVRSTASLARPRFRRRSGRIEAAAWTRLKGMAARAGLTPTGVLLAAFAEVLGSWSSSPRFCVSVTQFDRLPLHPQIDQVVGDFTSFMLVEVDCVSAPRFEDRAKRIQERLWEDLSHPYMSGVEVLRELARAQRSLGAAAMPVVFVSVLNQASERAGLSMTEALGTIGEIVVGVAQTSQVWLDHQVMEHGGELRFYWDSVDELFPEGMLEAVFGAYCRFVERLSDERAWDEPPLRLAPQADLALREEVNRTERPFPRRLLHGRLAEHAELHPDRIAVVSREGAMSYGQLFRLSNRIGRWLRDQGVRPNSLVAVVMEKGWEQVAAVTGILQAGGAYFPIDPRVPRDRLHYLLRYGEITVALTQASLDARLDWPEGITRVSLDVERFEGIADGPLSPAQRPDDLALVICTSGSTGTPRGVMLDHTGPLNCVVDCNERFGVGAGDRVISVTALHHDLSAYDIFGMIEAGGAIVLPDPARDRDAGHWAELVASQAVTVWNSVPAFLEMVATHVEERGGGELASLRLVLTGGDWIPLPLPDRLRALAPGLRVVGTGGPTETSILSNVYPIDAVDPSWKSIPYGKPIANQKIFVLNEALEACPTWVAGEIYNAGVGVAKGYWRDEDKTRERFFTHAGTGMRLYRTGDLGRSLPDGNIEILGRADFQVKLQGYRIELGEIEAALAQHPEVHACVVAAKGDPRGRKVLVAYFVPERDRAVAEEELRELLRGKLPAHMIPAIFVPLPELPLSANGKVDRRSLPDPGLEARTPREDAPRTPIEEALRGLVARVLGVEEARIGVRDSLFDLGANSLSVVQILSRVRKELGIDVPLARLFEDPTLVSLAEAVAAAQASPSAGAGEAQAQIPRRPDPATFPLSFAQTRLWFMEQLEPGLPIFNVHGFIRLRGQLDGRALEGSIEAIRARHEVLRATFHNVDGRPVQVIAPPSPIPLERVDLRALPSEAREAEITRRSRADVLRPFDLARGPLLRAILLAIEEGDHVLLLTTHHLVADAWSLGLLISELVELYKAHAREAAPRLPELPIQYADFAAWERELLRGQTLERMLSHWQGALAGAPRVLALPTDTPRSRAQSFEGALHEVAFSPALCDAIEAVTRKEGLTLFMTLLAGYAVMIRRYAGADRIVIGSPTANRSAAETEDLIGFFVNMLPLCVNLEGDPSFRELLERVRTMVVGAFAHQALPFEKLVEILQPQRDRATTPIFQVVLQLDNTPNPTIDLPGLRIELGSGDWGTARYDLALRLVRGPSGLTGAMNYRSKLWSKPSIARMMGDLEATLAWLVTNVDAPISRLPPRGASTRTDESAGTRAAPRSNPRSEKMSSLQGFKRRAVKVGQDDLVRFEHLEGYPDLPLAVRPNGLDVDLITWTANNRELVEKKLFENGAILFRGFHVDSVEKFRGYSLALSTHLDNYNERTSPRHEFGENIFSSTEYPADQVLHFHNANSYSHFWPMKIWFACIIKSEVGGRTPIADCRKVLEYLDPAITARLEEKRVMYQRTFMPGVGLSWQETFQTQDRGEVNAYCREAGIQCTWVSDNHLRTRQVRQAVAVHPITKERTWFNQLLLFHISQLNPEIAEKFLKGFADEDLPSNSYYGDGTPFEPEVIRAVYEAYERAKIGFDWEQGDVVLLDNMLVAHAREPFAGKRLITVAFSGRHYAEIGEVGT